MDLTTAAVIISIFSLLISFWSLHVQKKHNRKSLRPAGYIKLHDSLQGLSVKIVNKGCGPMYIKNFTAIRNSQSEKNILYHLPQNILDEITHTTHSEPNGYWLSPSEELTLIELSGNHEDKFFTSKRDTIRNILSKIETNLDFCDVYDEQYPAFHKSLQWFGRTL